MRRHEHLRFVEARRLAAVDRLSARELDVARRYASGKTYTEIAADLGVSPTTVRNQIARCYAKLGVSNKAELVHRLDAHDS